MFSNRFNTKNDPILGSIEEALKDGAIRRQAESLVNEEFGVYSRKAVIREQLAAYDARLEEAYKCMKEGKPLADKDYDKDGKIESPKDEVWGSRLRAAKMAGKLKEEEQIDEISKELATRYTKKSFKDMKQAADFGDTMSIRNRAKGIGMASKKLTGGAKVPANEETDYSAQDRAPVTKSPKGYEDPSTPKVPYSQLPKTQNRAGSVIDSAKGALKEAKYSAKAARAGEDIGKPGKMFKKIAAKAGERYGSEERGKKVAGAILAKIRAKHMKEDQSF